MGALKTYDPDQIVVSFAGIPIKGFADGEFVRVAQETEAFQDVSGTDGEVTRSKNNDKRATVTFILMQSSSANSLLSALHNLDQVTPGGAGVGALRIEDLQGETLYQAAQAWIQKAPDVSLDRTATSREWVLRCADLRRLDGGN